MRHRSLFLVSAMAALAAAFVGDFEAHGAAPRASHDLLSRSSASACSTDNHELVGAGQLDAGAVRIDNDGDNLIIHVVADGGWQISAVHIFAGTAAPPMNERGTVVPGQFPFETAYATPVTMHAQAIPLAALGAGATCGEAIDTIVHAVVRRPNAEGGGFREESVFGDGTPLPATRWGFSATRELCCEL